MTIAEIRPGDVGKNYTREYRFIRAPAAPKIIWLPRIATVDDVGKEVVRGPGGAVEITGHKVVKPKRKTKVCALCEIEKPVDCFRAKPVKKPDRTRIYFTYTPWCLECGARKYRLWREGQKRMRLEKKNAPISWREFGGLPVGVSMAPLESEGRG